MMKKLLTILSLTLLAVALTGCTSNPKVVEASNEKFIEDVQNEQQETGNLSKQFTPN